MFWFWPFNPPHPPDGFVLKHFAAVFEAAYWAGVKDGLTTAAIVGLLLYVLLSKSRES